MHEAPSRQQPWKREKVPELAWRKALDRATRRMNEATKAVRDTQALASSREHANERL